MAGVRTFRPHMGSRQARASYGASNQALTADFRAGMAAVLQNYSDFVEHMEGVTPEVLRQAISPTMDKAVRYCPKDSGALANSKFLEVESRRGQHVVAIGFGRGGQPGYAVYVHELPYAHDAPTRSKFLQAAVDEDYAAYEGRVGRLLKMAAGT